MKPKRTSARFNTLLMQQALSCIDTASIQDLNHIMQGLRNKNNKNLYMRMRKTILERKNDLFPNDLLETPDG